MKCAERLSGSFVGSSHLFPIRIYYDDTDAGGIVYHTRYMVFAEHARTEFLRLLGTEQRQLYIQQDCLFVVRRVQIEYKASARLDDVVIVESSLIKVENVRVTFQQHIKKEGQVLVALVVEVALITEKGIPKRMPLPLLEAFQRIRMETAIEN